MKYMISFLNFAIGTCLENTNKYSCGF